MAYKQTEQEQRINNGYLGSAPNKGDIIKVYRGDRAIGYGKVIALEMGKLRNKPQQKAVIVPCEEVPFEYVDRFYSENKVIVIDEL
jgi:hypothetical protein